MSNQIFFTGSSFYYFSKTKYVLQIISKHIYAYLWDMKINTQKVNHRQFLVLNYFFTDWPFRSTRHHCLAIQVLKHVAHRNTIISDRYRLTKTMEDTGGMILGMERDGVEGRIEVVCSSLAMMLSDLLPDLCAREFLSRCATGKH